MSFVIGKQFSFAAAHHLNGLPSGHKCARMHGHTYTVELMLASDVLDAAGFVADYADLDPLGRYIAEELDHRDLNDVLPVQPSCENIARHLHEWCQANLTVGPLAAAVRVSESPHTWAEYRPSSVVSSPPGYPE